MAQKPGTIVEELQIVVDRHPGVKCPRCGHYHHVKENYECLCDRCCQVMIADHPDHESVPGIKASIEVQRRKYLG